MAKAERKPMGRPPKPPGEKYPRVTITLPPEMLAKVDQTAKKLGLDRSAAIQGLIEQSLRAKRTQR